LNAFIASILRAVSSGRKKQNISSEENFKFFLAIVKILWEMTQATHHFTTLCANHPTQK